MSEKRILIFDANTQMLSVVEERPDYQDETRVELAEHATPDELRLAILYFASVRKATEEHIYNDDTRHRYTAEEVYYMFVPYFLFIAIASKENLL